jgi:ABC-type transporter Mla subunit MlaD
MLGRRRQKGELFDAEGSEDSASGAEERSNLRLHEALAGVTQQIEEITEAAERSAAQTRSKAEGEAEALLERRRREAERLAAETEVATKRLAAEREAAAVSVVEQTRRAVSQVSGAVAGLRQQLDAAIEELRHATAKLDESVALVQPSKGEPSAEPADSSASAASASSADSGGTRAKAKPSATASNPGARATARPARPLLRAVQMAMAGSSREEIGTVLRDEFGVKEPDPILDEAMGRVRE